MRKCLYSRIFLNSGNETNRGKKEKFMRFKVKRINPERKRMGVFKKKAMRGLEVIQERKVTMEDNKKAKNRGEVEEKGSKRKLEGMVIPGRGGGGGFVDQVTECKRSKQGENGGT